MDDMGVSKNSGTPKWMVYNGMENPIKMDELRVPLFLETPISIPLPVVHYRFHPEVFSLIWSLAVMKFRSSPGSWFDWS